MYQHPHSPEWISVQRSLKSPVESARHRHLKSIKKKTWHVATQQQKNRAIKSSEQGAPLVVAVLLRYQPLPFTPCYHFAVITEISHQVAPLGFITSQFFNHSRRLPLGGCLRRPLFLTSPGADKDCFVWKRQGALDDNNGTAMGKGGRAPLKVGFPEWLLKGPGDLWIRSSWITDNRESEIFHFTQ